MLVSEPAGDLQVFVSALARLRDDVERLQPTHVLSLLDPELRRVTLGEGALAEEHHTFLFRDVVRPEEPGGCSPTQLLELLTLLQRIVSLAATRPVRLLVHCHQGQSRSPALAYAALALHLGPGREREAWKAMRAAAPNCWPNGLLVAAADEQLGRGGALLAELEAFRRRFRPPSGARFL